MIYIAILLGVIAYLLIGAGLARESRHRGWFAFWTICVGPIATIGLVTIYFLREGCRWVKDQFGPRRWKQ
jgi:hypothetical protein